MLYQFRAYTGTHVVTKSDQLVGKLMDMEIDSDTGRITTLIVKTKGIVPGLIDDTVLIPWSAVIEMQEDKVIVTDASIKVKADRRLARVVKSAASASGLMKGQ